MRQYGKTDRLNRIIAIAKAQGLPVKIVTAELMKLTKKGNTFEEACKVKYEK